MSIPLCRWIVDISEKLQVEATAMSDQTREMEKLHQSNQAVAFYPSLSACQQGYRLWCCHSQNTAAKGWNIFVAKPTHWPLWVSHVDASSVLSYIILLSNQGGWHIKSQHPTWTHFHGLKYDCTHYGLACSGGASHHCEVWVFCCCFYLWSPRCFT